jgi:nucleoside-diphosphate-sugar epimerase
VRRSGTDALLTPQRRSDGDHGRARRQSLVHRTVVTGTGRNRYRAGRVRGGAVCWQEADVCDAAAIRRLCTGKDLVYHTAALSTPWAPMQLLREVNVGGTRNVVEGCLAHGVKRLVHVSSTAIFFQYRDRLHVRDDEPWPHRFCCPYAASKAQAERVVWGGVERGLNAVIVRARAVFGPGDNAILPRLLGAASARRLRQVGTGRNITDLTYVDNLIYALALAADQGGAGGTDGGRRRRPTPRRPPKIFRINWPRNAPDSSAIPVIDSAPPGTAERDGRGACRGQGRSRT